MTDTNIRLLESLSREQLIEINRRLRAALKRIADWRPPLVVSRGEPVPMCLAIGSNGERDHFRDVARAALQEKPND